jgi:hypothetical protein
MLALRKEQGIEALKTITDRLRVQDMGPADHIYTKHEVKAFLETGDVKAAEEILKRAAERLTFWERESVRMSRERGQRMRW